MTDGVDVDLDVEVVPVTRDRWDQLDAFAEPNGFYSGCWCTWWLLSAKEWDAMPVARRRAQLRDEVVERDVPPGLVALRAGAVVGWVRVGPRDDHPRMQRSPKLKPVDDEPVWMVSCFVVRRDVRRQGIGRALLRAAVAFAEAHGATAVEGVPIDTAGSSTGAAALFTGTLGTFESEGFVEIARRGGRPVVRRRR